MYELIETSRLERRLVRLRRAHPDLKQRILQVFADLRDDPFQPRLRLHALHGEHEGLHAVRVSYEYRITLVLKITEREIILLDIGSHDAVYR